MKIYYTKTKYIEIIIRKRIDLEKFKEIKYKKEGIYNKIQIYKGIGLNENDAYKATKIFEESMSLIQEYKNNEIEDTFNASWQTGGPEIHNRAYLLKFEE